MKVEEQKRHMDDHLRQREQWKAEEMMRMEEENRRIAEFHKEMEQREALQRQEKKMKDEGYAAVQLKLAEDIARKERERDEMEQIRQELYLAEQEEADELKQRVSNL